MINDTERLAALELARQGDLQARGRLLESYRPYIRVLVRGAHPGYLQARVADSDLIQDAMLEAHRAFADFRGESVAELLTWLRVIVLRTVRNVRRSHEAAKREVSRDQHLDDLHGLASGPGSSPSAHAIRHEEAAQIAEALGGLPEDMQQVLLGRHQEGASYAVLAERLGRTELAVRILYTRALRKLRQEFLK